MFRSKKIRIQILDGTDDLVVHKDIRRSFEFEAFTVKTTSHSSTRANVGLEQAGGQNQLIRNSSQGVVSQSHVYFSLDSVSFENRNDIFELTQIHRQHRLALDLRQRLDMSNPSFDSESHLAVLVSCEVDGAMAEILQGNIIGLQVDPHQVSHGREQIRVHLSLSS